MHIATLTRERHGARPTARQFLTAMALSFVIGCSGALAAVETVNLTASKTTGVAIDETVTVSFVLAAGQPFTTFQCYLEWDKALLQLTSNPSTALVDSGGDPFSGDSFDLPTARAAGVGLRSYYTTQGDTNQPNATLMTWTFKALAPGIAVVRTRKGALFDDFTKLGNESGANRYPEIGPAISIAIVAPAVNARPTVNAGLDQTITLPATASLSATAADDGLPAPSTLTRTWTMVGGPGTVTFSAPNALITTASFSVAGTYDLQLAVGDGALTGTDQVRVTVNPLATGGTGGTPQGTGSGGGGGGGGCGLGSGLVALLVPGLLLTRRRPFHQRSAVPLIPRRQIDSNIARKGTSLIRSCFVVLAGLWGGLAAVEPPAFSAPRGIAAAPFSLSIVSPSAGATVRYTTNGTPPSATAGTVYSAPLTIDRTTVVRAIAIAADATVSVVKTRTFIFVSDILAQPDQAKGSPPSPSGTGISWGGTRMDQSIVGSNRTQAEQGLLNLPIISIAMSMDELFQYDGSINDIGIMPNAIAAGDNIRAVDPLGKDWERGCSVEFIPRAPETEVQIDGCIEIAGRAARTNRKQAFEVKFKAEYGPTVLTHPLFPKSHVARVDKFRLKHCWSTKDIPITDTMSYDSQIAMEGDGQHSRFVNVYLNGIYWGMYFLTEVGSAGFAEAHLGGDKEDWDVIRPNSNGAADVHLYDTQLASGLSSRLAEPAIYRRYAELVDQVTWADGLIFNVFTGHGDFQYEDWLPRNRRTGQGFVRFPWDMDGTFASLLANGPSYFFAGFPDQASIARLQNADFRILLADRIRKHLSGDGALTAGPYRDRIQKRYDEIGDAMVADVARWNGYFYSGSTLANYADRKNTLLNTFAAQRAGHVLNWFRAPQTAPGVAGLSLYPLDAPDVSPSGRVFSGNLGVTIGRPASAPGATVYYTLDGSDPRQAVSGAIASGAIALSGSSTVLNLTTTTRVRARCLSGSIWSGATDLVFRNSSHQDLGKLRVSEIMYHPLVKPADQPPAGLRQAGYNSQYPSDSIDTTNPPLAMEAVSSVIDANWGTGSPGPGINADNYTMSWFGYLRPRYDEVYTMTIDGLGSRARLALADHILIEGAISGPISRTIALKAGRPYPISVQLSKQTGNGRIRLSWSSPSQASETVPASCFQQDIAEARDFEYLELVNRSANPLDLGGTSFRSGIRYRFPESTILAPGARYLLVSNPIRMAARHPTVRSDGIFAGTLSNSGDTITFHTATGEPVWSQTYGVRSPWPTLADGFGRSLVRVNDGGSGDPNDPASWRASGSDNGSPGAIDPIPGPAPALVINELLTHTDAPIEDAIEIFNPTSSAVDLGGWWLSDKAATPQLYRIPNGTTISAGGYFSTTAFSSAFQLSSTGEQVILSSPDLGYVQVVDFDASGNGVSFGRHVTSVSEVHYPAQVATTLGAVNSGPRVGPLVISEILYQPDATRHEFLELANISNAPLNCFDPAHPENRWEVAGIGFTFPAGVTIPAGGVVVLVKDTTTAAVFRSANAVPANVPIFIYTGSLDNSGESLRIRRPDAPNIDPVTSLVTVPMILVDRIRYGIAAPWPVGAIGTGSTIQRRMPTTYGDDPANWQLSAALGGTPGTIATAPNTAPTISALPNQMIAEDASTSALAFTVGDAETSPNLLRVTVSSPQATLLPTGSMVLGGSGANRSVVATPATDRTGVATITLTVSDGSLSTSSSFQLTVNAVNDPPLNTAPPSITGTAQVAQTVTVSTGTWDDSRDGNAPPTAFSFQWRRANDAAGSGLAAIPGATASSYVPVSGDLGKYLDVLVTATDSGTPGSAMASAPSNRVGAVANILNTPPVISPLAGVTMLEDGSSGPLSITISDAQTAAAALTLTAISSNLALVPASGLVLGGSDGNRTASVTPLPDRSGSTTITLTVSDGSLSTSTTLQVTVNAVNDPPVNTTPPAITGIAQVGQTLSVASGTWNDDKDGRGPPTAFTYQWRRANDAAGSGLAVIIGANLATYVPGSADVGKFLDVLVSATDSGNPGTAVASAASNRSPAIIPGVVAGDLNGTGTVTFEDLTLFLSSYRRSVGDPRYLAGANLVNLGSSVDKVDFDDLTAFLAIYHRRPR